MSISIERENQTAVYEQIAQQIRERIAAGELGPGMALPTVRTLASDLGVNLNTVARAYRLLEEQGFLVIQDRSGVQVAAPAASLAPGDRNALMKELQELAARMRQAGFSMAELEAAWHSTLGVLDLEKRKR